MRKRSEKEKASDRAYRIRYKDRRRELERNRRHIRGENLPMSESKRCSSYLGVYIAERVLSKFFDHIERMPYGNPGYDFICGRGFKIDVKSSCLRIFNTHKRTPAWHFGLDQNIVADYFLCLGFDNRENLEPCHVWLIPGPVINHLILLAISSNPNTLKKWVQYEKPLDKVIACCNVLRSTA